MGAYNRLSNVFRASERIPFDNSSKIVLMSDCHRGDGSWADDFARNQNIYYAALSQYYHEGFMYIELGDGDELWENRVLSEIINIHTKVFTLLSKFYREKRLYCIFGNHDMEKRNHRFTRNLAYRYYDETQKNQIMLYENMHFHEGLLLQHTETEETIFLVHGHQVDFFNDTLWKVCRFLVRYFWRTLEVFGFNDLTSAAKNYEKRVFIEKKLTQWVKKEKQMLIAGHTHRPVFPKPSEPPYFNTGSCVHPASISAIEIIEGVIRLVKWTVKTRSDGSLYVGKELLAEPQKLADYFKNHK